MNVYLSPLAQDQLIDLLDYLEENWSVKVRDNFLFKLEASLAVISNQPEAFQVSGKMPGLRRCVVTPNTILYYRIHQTDIEIAALIDARRDV